MAWAIDQAWAPSSTGGTGTTLGFTYGGAVAAGSTLVCFVYWQNAVTITGISDTVNGAWSEITATGIPVSGLGGAALRRGGAWIFPNSAAGTPTGTITFSDVAAIRSVVFASYSGVVTVSPFDVGRGQGQENPGTGADAVTTGATSSTTQANNLAVAVSGTGTAVTYTAGTSGWTSRFNANLGTNYKINVQDINVAVAGVVTPTWTIDDTGADPLSMVITLKEVSGLGRLILSSPLS